MISKVIIKLLRISNVVVIPCFHQLIAFNVVFKNSQEEAQFIQSRFMVAYYCHHLPGNYVDMSDPYVDFSDHHVDLSDHYVDLSERNNLVGYIVFKACESPFLPSTCQLNI